MSKEKFRYLVTLLKFPKGHGFREHLTTTKKGAFMLGKKLGGMGRFRIRKLRKPKVI